MPRDPDEYKVNLTSPAPDQAPLERAGIEGGWGRYLLKSFNVVW